MSLLPLNQIVSELLKKEEIHNYKIIINFCKNNQFEFDSLK
jgi:hypothetical protein